MKTRTHIALCLILLLCVIAISSFAQGIKNSGGFITDAGTTSYSYLKFSGSSDMTISGTTADQTTLGNMNVDFTGSGTYKLTIPDNSFVTVEGNLNLADSLHLNANSSGNMASLITNGSVSGAYGIVEQHLTADLWHMVSSPVSAAVSGVYTGIYLYKWNEPDSTWNYITSTTESLTVTRGYHAYSSSSYPSPTDVAFTGLLNTGDYSPSLSYNAGLNKGDGWNEIGNPYPSSLEWNSSWTKSYVDATIYLYDGTQYKTWNYNTGGSLSNGEIPPTQGFWVKANASSPSLTIPNAERVHSSNTFYKGSNVIQNIVKIDIDGNGYSDELSVGMFEDATDDFDSDYDAYKLMGIEAAPQLYSIDATNLYAVNLITQTNDSRQVLLGLRVGESNEYTFSFDGLDDFNPNTSVYLEDKLSGEFINLNETDSYTCYAEEGTDDDRFILHFNPEFTGVDSELILNQIGIYANDKTIFVNYQNVDPAQVFVFDLLGKEVLMENLSPNQLNTIAMNHNNGYYIVKVITNDLIKTQKVFVE